MSELEQSIQGPPTVTRQATRLGIPPLGHYLTEAWRYRTFALYWSRADIKARNFETFLGRAWHILNPFLFGLIYFVFVVILSDGDISDTSRLAFIVGNLYVWGYFSSTITSAVSAVQDGAGGVMAQSAIPRAILPVASTITATNLFLKSLVAYIPLHLIAARGLHIEMLWLPLLILLTGMFGFGIGLLMAVLNVYFRDVSRLLPHLLRLWLYLSPAIWAYTRLLEGDWHHVLGRLNPMYSGMTAWTIAFGGSLTDGSPTMVGSVAVFAIWATSLLVIGFLVFVSREDDFAIRN